MQQDSEYSNSQLSDETTITVTSHSHTTTVNSQDSILQQTTSKVYVDVDYHNIHTQHRPKGKKQTQDIHMATLFLKVFPKIKAIPENVDLHPESPVTIPKLKLFISSNMDNL